jgi:hypothetical protein
MRWLFDAGESYFLHMGAKDEYGNMSVVGFLVAIFFGLLILDLIRRFVSWWWKIDGQPYFEKYW